MTNLFSAADRRPSKSHPHLEVTLIECPRPLSITVPSGHIARVKPVQEQHVCPTAAAKMRGSP